jgi:pyrimidine-specific ribonucleoside hydrolase
MQDKLTPIRLVIDTDPGIDDAMTLALAAVSPDVDLRAVTTVAGNVSLPLTTANALALLHAVGRDDVPVAAGAERGLVRVKPRHSDVHGVNGLGGVTLPAPPRGPCGHHAVNELARILREPGEPRLTIVAIAPLTNLALLLGVHPELSDRIERIVVMGGSSGRGNVTPSAEYNTWADPEAAARVLDSGVPIWLAQLQATRDATLDPMTRRQIAAESALGARLIEMMDGYDEGPGMEPALHDVVALAVVIDPSLAVFRPARVEVVMDSGPRRGATVINFDAPPEGGPVVEVVVHVDVVRLRALLADRLAAARAT